MEVGMGQGWYFDRATTAAQLRDEYLLVSAVPSSVSCTRARNGHGKRSTLS